MLTAQNEGHAICMAQNKSQWCELQSWAKSLNFMSRFEDYDISCLLYFQGIQPSSYLRAIFLGY
jgi:hypothetical protein